MVCATTPSLYGPGVELRVSYMVVKHSTKWVTSLALSLSLVLPLPSPLPTWGWSHKKLYCVFYGFNLLEWPGCYCGLLGFVICLSPPPPKKAVHVFQCTWSVSSLRPWDFVGLIGTSVPVFTTLNYCTTDLFFLSLLGWTLPVFIPSPCVVLS